MYIMNRPLLKLSFSNTFASLGEHFFSFVNPTPFESKTDLVHFNFALGEQLGIKRNEACLQELTDLFSGAHILPGIQPLAMLYAGHQFGHFVSQLGDGRAILLGELKDIQGDLYQVQLKGAGRTPYSRDGDGRAVLRSTIREYLCSEAMHGLGIETTRALCMVVSHDEVYRETVELGAVLTRVAKSHIRFGSFEVFYYRSQFENLKKLADYTIDQYFPCLAKNQDKYIAWLEQVIKSTAQMLAQWQAVGFCHGVMNSDNMSVLGLTIDYGPFGFMESFDPGYVCNHSDYQGRYAYDQQPKMGLFNLSCFAQAILPLLNDDPQVAGELAKTELEKYYVHYKESYISLIRKKLGLSVPMPEDESMLDDLLNLLAEDKVDYSIFFRQLCGFSTETNNCSEVRDLFINRIAFDEWAKVYSVRLKSENTNDHIRKMAMKKINPKFILRNYMAELAIRKAVDEHDYSEIDKLFSILQTPYDEHPENESFAGFPPDWANQISVSCSS